MIVFIPKITDEDAKKEIVDNGFIKADKFSAFEAGMPFNEEYVNKRAKDKGRLIFYNKKIHSLTLEWLNLKHEFFTESMRPLVETVKTDYRIIKFVYNITKYNTLLLCDITEKVRAKAKKKKGK